MVKTQVLFSQVRRRTFGWAARRGWFRPGDADLAGEIVDLCPASEVLRMRCENFFNRKLVQVGATGR